MGHVTEYKMANHSFLSFSVPFTVGVCLSEIVDTTVIEQNKEK